MNCVHYWEIDMPDGRFSIGICKKCGEERKFCNVYQEANIFNRGTKGFRWRNYKSKKRIGINIEGGQGE